MATESRRATTVMEDRIGIIECVLLRASRGGISYMEVNNISAQSKLVAIQILIMDVFLHPGRDEVADRPFQLQAPADVGSRDPDLGDVHMGRTPRVFLLCPLQGDARPA